MSEKIEVKRMSSSALQAANIPLPPHLQKIHDAAIAAAKQGKHIQINFARQMGLTSLNKELQKSLTALQGTAVPFTEEVTEITEDFADALEYRKQAMMGRLAQFQPTDKQRLRDQGIDLRDQVVMPFIEKCYWLWRNAVSPDELYFHLREEFKQVGIVFECQILSGEESPLFEVLPTNAVSMLVWNQVMQFDPNSTL